MTKADMTADDVAMYLLDVVVDDVESLDDILRRLNADTEGAWWRSRGKRFDRQELVGGLSGLIARDLVRAYVMQAGTVGLEPLPEGVLPQGGFSEAWFGITPAGRMKHAAWEPPPAR